MRNRARKLVIQELMDIQDCMPDTCQYITRNGMDLFFAMDGSGRRVFEGTMVPTEICCAKPHIPGVDEAQQSPHLGIPMFLYEGKEDHVHLSVVIGALKEGNAFVESVQMPDGSCITVQWHLER